jgi:hypothetical protein
MIDDFRIATMQDSSVLMIYSKRAQIKTDPPYQRMSDVWNLDKRQLLIDSLLNGFDIRHFSLDATGSTSNVHGVGKCIGFQVFGRGSWLRCFFLDFLFPPAV